MKKAILASLLLTILMMAAAAQTSLYVGSGAGFYIGAGTPVNIDGFVLTPSVGTPINPVNSITRNSTATPPPSSPYIQRVYQLLQSISSFSGSITISYLDAELNGINENTLNLTGYDGSIWKVYPTTNRDAVNNTVTAAGLSNINFSQLTLSAGVALPVSLIDFSAQALSCQAYLKWSTATEENSSSFRIEASTDAIQFHTVGELPAAGNSSAELHYQFTAALSTQLTYFRLKLIDLDGRFTYSKIIVVQNNCGLKEVKIFPNPVVRLIQIQGLSGESDIRIFNSVGQIVRTISTTQSVASIDVSALPAGSYVMEILKDGRQLKSSTFIKKKE